MHATHDFDRASFWFARHEADGDVLVYDPALADDASENLTFFSMTALRQRRFPPAVVRERLRELSGAERAEVEKRYREWPALREQKEREEQAARAETAARERARVVERHRALFDERGLDYPGVRDSAEEAKRGVRRSARTVCPRCGIHLDDFAGVRCAGCGTILCSCGGCACVTAPRVVAAE